MRSISSVKTQVPFPFVLEELVSIRPTIKRMFGFTYVYLGEKLLFSLRDSVKQPGSNGMWLFTTAEHVESLGREFPQLPKRQLWRSGQNCWVILASRLAEFEEYAFKACELLLNGDQRIGRVTRGGVLIAATADDSLLRKRSTVTQISVGKFEKLIGIPL
jgi:hypothetical protein